VAKKSHLHVVPAGTDWNVQRQGAAQPTSTHRTQTAAENAAKQIARREGGEVYVHRPNGQIRDRDSFGNDPAPPIDKKH
jgi:hypothetical protein